MSTWLSWTICLRKRCIRGRRAKPFLKGKSAASPFRKGGLRGILSAMLLYNNNLKKYSRELRKNMTDAERCLWSKVRAKQLNGYQFYRQRIIGNYIVDFFCPRAKLVIEVDGSQHYSDEIGADRIRDEYMKNHELKVLRFSDYDVLKNVDGVVENIIGNMRAPNEKNPP